MIARGFASLDAVLLAWLDEPDPRAALLNARANGFSLGLEGSGLSSRWTLTLGLGDTSAAAIPEPGALWLVLLAFAASPVAPPACGGYASLNHTRRDPPCALPLLIAPPCNAHPPVALGAALALLSLSPSLGGAAVHTFTGSSSANWSAEANWVGGLPAILGEVLLDSPTRPASFNDIAGGLTLLGLTLGPIRRAHAQR